MTYDEAFALLRKYNSEPFQITHALTVSNVMRRMANELGYGDEADFWAIVGLLHDIDFEQWPNEHCKKCVELLQAGRRGRAADPRGRLPRLRPVRRCQAGARNGKGALCL